MNIFLYDGYKQLLKEKIRSFPKHGRGQIEKIAKAVGVHQSFISQVLHTPRHLSEEQAYLVCRYFEFSDLETEYFLALLQKERATTDGLKKILARHTQRLKKHTEPTKGLDRNLTSLAEDDKQIFYSHWHYMAVWLLTATPRLDSIEKIAKHLNLSDQRVKDVVEFLIHVGLCENHKGKLSIKIKRTLVTKGSPMLTRHHTNWRLRSIDLMETTMPNALFYTHPMNISEKDGEVIREILIKAITAIEPMVEPSQSEKTFCLNIDWFEF